MVAVLGYFNPRTHTGCDCKMKSSSNVAIKFQSTHPHGVRLASIGEDNSGGGNFNPRTHTGCDEGRNQYESDLHYFNPRTHTGCDTHTYIAKVRGYFNPRTHTGCDFVIISGYQVASPISIHAPTRGATSRNGKFIFYVCGFQSTHPHGVRLVAIKFILGIV